MVSLAATFGRGAMTNHWRDIRHADLILVNGANPAEAHPVGFRWLMRAKLDRGAKIIHADPRFTRTSAVADTYVRIRTGTDVAYFGGLINYVLSNGLQHDEYVRWATNAGFVVKDGYAFKDGMFNGFDRQQGVYNTKLWAYETDKDGHARIDLDHPRSVLNLLREHYRRYDPDTVSRITGIPREQFLQVARLVGETGRPDKVMTIVYAVGLTHHTTGVQLIRSGAILQLLLGNMGRPGGGMNAERGHANIQGNTDHAISWDILPGYLRIPAPGQKDIAAYLDESASIKQHPRAVNFFGENYRRYLVSLLKTWYGDAATKDNEWAFDYLPKPAANASWISIFDQALRGKMQGVMLSGMTATSIGPDSGQVLQALSNLKWLCVLDPFNTTSSEFWRAPGLDPAKIQTEVFMLPATHWIEKDGSFTNSGRWSQWKEQVLPPDGEARHDHWIMAELFLRVRDLYESQGGKFPDPLLKLTLPYRNPRKPELDEIAQEINGRDLKTGKRLMTFVDLKDDGTTTAGDWIYTGHYPEEGNLTKRRDGVQDPARNDPSGMGLYPNWAWSWPANRRILYNRASADENGRPWDPERPGIAWVGGKWVGDVPDYPPTTGPGPDAPLPFIMTGEGVGRLFSNAVADGPFPEHYEPVESPVANPLHPQVSATPVVFRYDERAGRPNRFGTPADYPYVATSYRLTEHEHYVTQNVEHLVQLQPEAFVEVPAGLAAEKGIETGDLVRVSSRRGKLEVRAVVTKRLGPLEIDGRRVYQIGIPIHWGFVGINTGQHWLANALTPFVGDASARTPEYKAFLVDIEKL
ncbi:formate dehydrogenase-N subunit alpha [Nonomuraea sp. NPDC050404]|uniref:formate dehydrogenase-N subunit alpha n=1 Tax=Nonomuraea sp. NPDC050404 TaxID=3155783 RepID=UPI0033F8D46E